MGEDYVSNGVDARVRNFVRFFDNDAEAAIAAIRDYTDKPIAVKPAPHRDSSDILLSVHDVAKQYKVGRQSIAALQNVNLTIYKGEIVALTGTSGSGKSTLLHILGCIDRPSSGQVLLGGRDVTRLHDAALSTIRRSTIGFVFQSFYLQPFLRLRDNVAVPAMFTNAEKARIDDKVAQLLRQVGLEDRAAHYPKELSGGQIQRAAIARALVNEPQIILADEPTGNLDSATSRSIIDLFKSIREKLGTTIIIVTHDRDIARQADRVITLKDGVII